MRAFSCLVLAALSVQVQAACIALSGGDNYYTETNSSAKLSILGASSSWGAGSGISGGSVAPGRTFLQTEPTTNRLQQSTWITRFDFLGYSGGAAPSTNTIKLKLFRPNGAVYDFVSQSESFSNLVTGATNVCNLSTPIFAREGDLPAIFLSYDAAPVNIQHVTTLSGATNHYGAGDITSSGWNPTDHLSNFILDVVIYGAPALAGYTGDSLMAGHNVGSSWYPYLDTANPTITGTASSAIPFVCWQTNGLTALYLNAASGSQTYTWIVSTGGPAITNQQSSIMVVLCGVNDINTGRTWAQVAGNLDSVRLMHPRPKPLFISEILPWTNGSDAQALTLRTWNTNLAGWCSTNSATMLPMHDALGKIRVSTGYLDDLATAYDQDGVHLKQAGVNAYAKRLYEALRRVTQ